MEEKAKLYSYKSDWKKNFDVMRRKGMLDAGVAGFGGQSCAQRKLISERRSHCGSGSGSGRI